MEANLEPILRNLREELEKPMPYKWRVQSFSRYKSEAICVAYVDSRQVRDRLTDVYDVGGWSDEYYQVKNSLFCRITANHNGVSVSKSDCGVESNMDALKGESSDAFKRAAVKFGVGRFLYDLGMFTVDTDVVWDGGKNKPKLIGMNNQRIYDLTGYINDLEFNSLKNMKKCAENSPMRVIADTILSMVDFDNDHDGSAIFEGQSLLREITRTNRNPHGFVNFHKFYSTKSNQKMARLHDIFATQAEMMLIGFENSENS